MREREIAFAAELKEKIASFAQTRALPGLNTPERIDCMVSQLIASVRRVKYVRLIRDGEVVHARANPTSSIYDPLRAAKYFTQEDNFNEACWQVFLATHFGKNLRTDWTLCKEFYLGDSMGYWTWNRVIDDLGGLENWLFQNHQRLKTLGGFGNHRKYQSLDPQKKSSTIFTIESYVNWVTSAGGHRQRFTIYPGDLGDTPGDRFDFLYQDMNAVVGFGRMGKFDFLTMIGKLGLADIEPSSPYIGNATGPKSAAKMLFGGAIAPRELNGLVTEFAEHLQLDFGMQVAEDALCNWQKSPDVFLHFRG